MNFTAGTTSPLRAQLLARLAAERAFLLQQFEGLEEGTLTHDVVFEGWTAAGLLAHLAYWEAVAADRLAKLAGGRLSEIRPPAEDDAVATHDAGMQAAFAHLSFDEALAMAGKERRNFLLSLNQVSDGALVRRVRLRPCGRITPLGWARWPYRHDAEHAVDVARWRRTYPPNHPSLRVIHRTLLRPLLGLSRREFMALAALLPPKERETRPLDGSWSLKQLIGHLSDYERLGVVALKDIAAGREPVYDPPIADFEEYNIERGAAWAGESWDETWARSEATRRVLSALADNLPVEALARPFTAPWRQTTTACGYILDMAQHEQEHADALRRALDLPPLPRRLGRAR